MRNTLQITAMLLLILSSNLIIAQEGWYYQVPFHVNDIHFFNSQKCIAVGEGVWVSEDAGESWCGYHPGYKIGSYTELNSVHFTNQSDGYAVGHSDIVIKTINGGKNWEKLYIPNEFPNGNQFDDVCFIDANIGFVAGYTYNNNNYLGIIYKTVDGGKNWQLVYSGIHIRLITSTENGTLWAGGSNGVLLNSTNTGEEWNTVDLPMLPNENTLRHLEDIKFADNNHGIIAIMANQYIYRTEDGGNSWEIVDIGVEARIRNISYFTDGTVYAIFGYSSSLEGFYESSDHGKNWSSIYETGNEFGSNGLSPRIAFGSKTVGIAYGGLFHTNDGGKSWESKTWGGNSLAFLNQNEGWANASQFYYPDGVNGCILKTTDGFTWKMIPLNIPETESLVSISKFQIINSTTLYALASGQVLSNRKMVVLLGTLLRYLNMDL